MVDYVISQDLINCPNCKAQVNSKNMLHFNFYNDIEFCLCKDCAINLYHELRKKLRGLEYKK